MGSRPGPSNLLASCWRTSLRISLPAQSVNHAGETRVIAAQVANRALYESTTCWPRKGSLAFPEAMNLSRQSPQVLTSVDSTNAGSTGWSPEAVQTGREATCSIEGSVASQPTLVKELWNHAKNNSNAPIRADLTRLQMLLDL